jgi:hypothetical protein
MFTKTIEFALNKINELFIITFGRIYHDPVVYLRVIVQFLISHESL